MTEIKPKEYYCPDCGGKLKNVITRVLPHTDRECIVYLKSKFACLTAELARLRSEREWIPVSERLPKDGNTIVLTLAKVKEVFLLSFDEYWFSPFDESGDEFQLQVTHWMPLPPPPTADRDYGEKNTMTEEEYEDQLNKEENRLNNFD